MLRLERLVNRVVRSWEEKNYVRARPSVPRYRQVLGSEGRCRNDREEYVRNRSPRRFRPLTACAVRPRRNESVCSDPIGQGLQLQLRAFERSQVDVAAFRSGDLHYC